MARIAVVALIVLGGLFLYVRHQFDNVSKAIAKPGPNGTWVQPKLPDSSRLKCALCGGRGQTTMFGGMNARSQSCSSCRGTGWVDNPAYVAMRRSQTAPKR